MARIFKTPFGAQGDTEQVPEAPQGDGSVSFTNGFGYDYEREYDDPAAKDVRREIMNGLFYDVTEAVGDIQLSGIAKWSADAAPYPDGAVVWHAGSSWKSRVGNNIVEPSEGASWSRLATINEVSSGYVPQSRTITAGTGLSGGGSLAANRTLSVNYGTTAGTAAQGNDSRIANAVPNSRQVNTGEGLSGGGDLASNRTLSVDSSVVRTSRSITAGTGLSGGGDLSASRTISIANSHIPIGVGQTWQDVGDSRVNQTNYTNTTGRTIAVYIAFDSGAERNFEAILVDGVGVGFASGNAGMSNFFLVPPGSVYRVDTPRTVMVWSELR